MQSVTNKNGNVFVTHVGVTALSKQTIRLACNSGTIDTRTLHLGMYGNVILYVIPEHIERLTIKHVNQRRLRDKLCISIRREVSR